MERKKYPIGPEYYTLYEEVGQGVSAWVHRALCIPLDEIVAIKILDFERDNCDLNKVSREAQTMILVDHPNLLKAHCSFVSDHNLWVVMQYMAGGSCLHMLKVAYPDGFEENIIATILREVLKGLEYLHNHGHIHRDVKAGNILIDSQGGIKLGDFGVSACLFDSGDRQRMRNTFVGTPCWMAPEVMEQLHGYDFRADIWSFGITSLELAHGHAPFSKFPPMKVLLMTLQNAPPGLDYERDKKFSKSFKQMIASCLVKDPSKRPTASKLLKHPFFKQARSSDYIERKLLEGLPALGNRMEALKKKEEDMLAQKKMADGQKEELSQNEYKRGISTWNFNLEDLKAQASLIQYVDDHSYDNNQGGSSSFLPVLEEDTGHFLNKAAVLPTMNSGNVSSEKSDGDSSITSPVCEQQEYCSPFHQEHAERNLTERTAFEINGKSTDPVTLTSHARTTLSELALPESIVLLKQVESDKQDSLLLNDPICNGEEGSPSGDDVLSELSSKASKSSVNTDEFDERAKPPVVQQRGRFKVTSENVDLEKVAPSPSLQKSHSMQVLSQHPATSLPSVAPQTDPSSSTICRSSLFNMLHTVLQTNILQRESILALVKQVSCGDILVNRATDGGCMPSNAASSEISTLEAAHDREKELLNEVTDLQWRLICAEEELQKYKADNAQVNFPTDASVDVGQNSQSVSIIKK